MLCIKINVFLKPAWQQVVGLELFISCSPSSCTRSPQLNFPELPGILTRACLYSLKSRQVMKLKAHWVYGKVITSSGSLFTALCITSHMCGAAAAEHRVGIHTRGTAVLQQTKTRVSTHQTITKTRSTEPLCFFSQCCA